MKWYPEFKIDSQGHLIGWGGVMVAGFTLDYYSEDYFYNDLEKIGAAEAVKYLDYL
jgi:hypothetical protein